MIRENKIVIEPLSYMRGRSLQEVFFIVDEVQNLAPHEIKTISTRAGDSGKLQLPGMFTRLTIRILMPNPTMFPT
jgi:PhoH-like ATPase